MVCGRCHLLVGKEAGQRHEYKSADIIDCSDEGQFVLVLFAQDVELKFEKHFNEKSVPFKPSTWIYLFRYPMFIRFENEFIALYHLGAIECDRRTGLLTSRSRRQFR